MTNHISKEISLMRVNSIPVLDGGISASKLQPFPRTLGRFFKKILTDLKGGHTQLIEAYCKDLFEFTETINYKTRGSGRRFSIEHVGDITGMYASAFVAWIN
jgi:hypothetical protein